MSHFEHGWVSATVLTLSSCFSKYQPLPGKRLGTISVALVQAVPTSAWLMQALPGHSMAAQAFGFSMQTPVQQSV